MVGLVDGAGSAGRCDWIGRQNLRCWVELGFCETLLSSSLEFKPIMSFLGWVERSACENDSTVSYWLILPVDVLGHLYAGHLGQQWWAEACDILFHGDGWVATGVAAWRHSLSWVRWRLDPGRQGEE